MNKDFREEFKKQVLTEWGDCFGINSFYDTINQYDEDDPDHISNIVITFKAQSLREQDENDYMLLVNPVDLFELVQQILTDNNDAFLSYVLQQAASDDEIDDGLPF